MYRKEILIVLSMYEGEDITSIWGSIGKPEFNNGNWLMPLGWEEELTRQGFSFEVKEIDYYYEEDIN